MTEPAAAPSSTIDWSSTGRGPSALIACLLLVATAALYAPSLDNGFLTLDDYQLIVENRVIQPPTAELGRVWRGPIFQIYMPLTYTLWAVESQVFRAPGPPGEPGRLLAGPFHMVCVGLHAVNVALVFWLLGRLGIRPLAAAVGALLFAVHPLQVESVYWITETKGTLSGLFCLLSLIMYVRFAGGCDQGTPKQNQTTSVARPSAARQAVRYLVATGCFVLALLAKPSAVVVPVVALLIDAGWLQQNWRRAQAALGPWLALAAGLAWVAKGAQGDELLEFVPQWQHRPLVALDALAFYARKLVLPVGLAIDHGRAPQAALKNIGPTLAWSALTLVLLAVLAFGWQRRRAWALAGAIFVATLLPVLGLVSFSFQTYSTVADRYAYLALVGPALALAVWLNDPRPWKAAVAGLLLLAAASGNVWQGRYWQDSRTLFERTLTVTPESWLAQLKLAVLEGQAAEEALAAGRMDDAQGYRDAELARYRETLQIKPDLAGARANLGFLFLRLDKPRDAAQEFEILLAQRPDESQGHTGLGMALFQLGDIEKAVQSFREVVRLRPQAITAHMQLGLALLKTGEFAAAQAAFARVLQEQPDLSEARWRLAQALQFNGEALAAVREYHKALRSKRTPPTVAADLAWLLATHEDPRLRQPDEALKLAQQACADESARRDPVRQEILAAALAAKGDFATAQSTARQAMALAQGSDPSLAEAIARRAARYAKEQPFTQPQPHPRAAAAIQFDVVPQE